MSEAAETIQMAAGDDTIRIRIPMKLKKRAGRKEIVLPRAATGAVPAQEALVRAVARAWKWQAMLESGEVASINVLATRFHVDHSYVARTLRLASLAPETVEMILDGDEPDGLTLGRLMKPWPGMWEEQREAFGLPTGMSRMRPSGPLSGGEDGLEHRPAGGHGRRRGLTFEYQQRPAAASGRVVSATSCGVTVTG
ncbi:MAG TPA: hypothetical protein PLP01_10220 [Phycisphaerae bacterium]|nr:hypothetical protein [Phycisphaerae bacterium]